MNVPFITLPVPGANPGAAAAMPEAQYSKFPTVDGAESSFQKLLDSEGKEVDVLDLLRGRLSEEQLEQLEALLADGKEALPDGKELPLPAIIALLQEAIESGVLSSPEGDGSATTAADKSANSLMSMLLREGRGRADGNASADQDVSALQPGDGEETADDLLPLKEMLRLLPADKQPAAAGEALRPAVLATLASSGALTPAAAADGAAPMPQLSAAAALTNSPLSQIPGQQPVPPAITVPPGEHGWDRAMGERILWMAGRDIQRAAIQIRPPNMGPLQIQLSIQNDQASLHFTASNGVVQDALEASIPRLREMLAEQNLQLVNVNVDRRDADNRDGLAGSQQGEGERGRNGGGLFGEEMETETDGPVHYYRKEGLLDDYA